MKYLSTMIFMVLFSFANISFAGVAAFNDSSYKGVFAIVKCDGGTECVKDGKNLKLRQNLVKTPTTFTSGDATPSVANGTYFNTFLNNTLTITNFDDGYDGEEIIVYSQGAVTFDVTGTALKCGSTDIVTASGDQSRWLDAGSEWRCTSFIDASDNLN